MSGGMELIAAAASDRRSGSAAVARAAAKGFAALDAEQVEEAVGVLLRGQPFMAAGIHLADHVLRGRPGAEFVERLDREARGTRSHLATLLPRAGVVLTVSYSSTVVFALCRRVRRRLTVLCAASEPGGEGRAAAERLREAGVGAEVIDDSAVAAAAARADLVCVGADAVGPRAFLNKAGTLAALLGARDGDRARVVAAGTTKFVDGRTWERVARAAPDRMLDVVPLRHLSAVVTEDGPLSPASAGGLARRTRLHLHQSPLA